MDTKARPGLQKISDREMKHSWTDQIRINVPHSNQQYITSITAITHKYIEQSVACISLRCYETEPKTPSNSWRLSKTKKIWSNWIETNNSRTHTNTSFNEVRTELNVQHSHSLHPLPSINPNVFYWIVDALCCFESSQIYVHFVMWHSINVANRQLNYLYTLN